MPAQDVRETLAAQLPVISLQQDVDCFHWHFNECVPIMFLLKANTLVIGGITYLCHELVQVKLSQAAIKRLQQDLLHQWS